APSGAPFWQLQVLAQKPDPVRGSTWSCQNGAPEGAGAQDYPCQASFRLRNFFLVHQLPDCRCVRQSGIFLFPRLHKYPCESILSPSATRFATEKSTDGCTPAVNLVSLDR